MELSTQIFLLLVAIGILFAVLGLARLSNPNRRRSRRRTPNASDAVHRTPFWLLGSLWGFVIGYPNSGGDGGGGDGGGGDFGGGDFAGGDFGGGNFGGSDFGGGGS